MILWSTKNAKKVSVDDVDFENDLVIKKTKDRDEFKGMTAAWYYNGKKMDNHFVLEGSDFVIERKGRGGRIVPQTKDKYIHSGDGKTYNVLIEKPDITMNFDISPLKEGFAKIRRETQSYFKTDFGYDLTEINRANFKGYIKKGSKKEDIKGTAYLQQVRVNAPAPPWYWGINHFQDGSILTYYEPHLGLPILRRSRKPHSSLLNGKFVMHKDIKFYPAEDKKLYRMRDIKVEREFNSKGLPVFHVSGKYKDMKAKFTCDSYSEVCWEFRHLGSKLFYNEYPVSITEFSFKKGSKEFTLDDLGYGYGNSEHSWGILV
jgi:hypothetical protein